MIGTVYGVQLASAGHHVSILRHGARTDEARRDGLVCHDINEGTPQRCVVAAVAEAALSRRGFDIARTVDMDGWLIYHAVFVASIAAALYRHGGDPVALADDRGAIVLNASSPPTPATPTTKCAPFDGDVYESGGCHRTLALERRKDHHLPPGSGSYFDRPDRPTASGVVARRGRNVHHHART